jgi:hypothetical protein
VERYDWPLLAILVLITLSIYLLLRAFRIAIGLLTRMWLELRIQRQIGIRESRAGIGIAPAPTK